MNPEATPTPAPEPAQRSAGGYGLNVAAVVLAWLLPGLGHLVLGHVARGLVLAVTIGSLWMGGLLIGGISVIDRQNHAVWFIGQMFMAPSLVVNHYHLHLRDTYHRQVGTRPDVDPGYEPAFGKPEEQGQLYTALAGLLNALVCMDVFYRQPHRRTADAAAPDPSPDAGSGKAEPA